VFIVDNVQARDAVLDLTRESRVDGIIEEKPTDQGAYGWNDT